MEVSGLIGRNAFRKREIDRGRFVEGARILKMAAEVALEVCNEKRGSTEEMCGTDAVFTTPHKS